MIDVANGFGRTPGTARRVRATSEEDAVGNTLVLKNQEALPTTEFSFCGEFVETAQNFRNAKIYSGGYDQGPRPGEHFWVRHLEYVQANDHSAKEDEICILMYYT